MSENQNGWPNFAISFLPLCAKSRSPNGSHRHLHPSSRYCGKYLSFFGAFQWFPKAKKPRSHLRFWWLLLSYSDKQKGEVRREEPQQQERKQPMIDVGNSESSKAHQFYPSCRVSSRFVAPLWLDQSLPEKRNWSDTISHCDMISFWLISHRVVACCLHRHCIIVWNWNISTWYYRSIFFLDYSFFHVRSLSTFPEIWIFGPGWCGRAQNLDNEDQMATQMAQFLVSLALTGGLIFQN